MVLKLLPNQIAELWDAIKVAAVKANRIADDFEQEYANHVLEALLSGRYEAWILCQEEEGKRQIFAIGITSIIDDTMMGYRALSMHTLFGFRPLSDDLKLETWGVMKAYAKANECHKLITTTGHSRIKDLAKMVGMVEDSVNYSFTL